MNTIDRRVLHLLRLVVLVDHVPRVIDRVIIANRGQILLGSTRGLQHSPGNRVIIGGICGGNGGKCARGNSRGDYRNSRAAGGTTKISTNRVQAHGAIVAVLVQVRGTEVTDLTRDYELK
ncbi:Uncharacterised protein [Mycobacteroides abscessus subsp. abscessus]|nr:Uncharacterised protein [Mycobacteroides abscessus subsp. abscessus]